MNRLVFSGVGLVPKTAVVLFKRSCASWSGLTRKSHFIDAPDGSNYKLHMLQIQNDNGVDGTPCFLLHGGTENGKIFYSSKSQGFAPYLARQGYNVFVPDLRGKGQSTPSISTSLKEVHGIKDVVGVTIPTFARSIGQLTNNQKQVWISHSYGGPLMAAAMARDPSLVDLVSCQVHFASKRRFSLKEPRNWLIFMFGYRVVCQSLINIFGYLPAKRFRIGSDDETKLAIEQGIVWGFDKPGSWRDVEDNFSYEEEYKKHILEKNKVPRGLVLAAGGDTQACEQDIYDWAVEVGIRECITLSRKNGNKADYDHFKILTGKTCDTDHFPLVEKWISKNYSK